MKKSIVVTSACLLMIALPAVVYALYRGWETSWRMSQDRNAIYQVQDMLSLHIAHHDGRLPERWDDLADDYDAVNPGYNNYSFDELQAKVEISFAELRTYSADPDAAPPVFVRAASGLRQPGFENTINARIATSIQRSVRANTRVQHRAEELKP